MKRLFGNEKHLKYPINVCNIFHLYLLLFSNSSLYFEIALIFIHIVSTITFFFLLTFAAIISALLFILVMILPLLLAPVLK